MHENKGGKEKLIWTEIAFQDKFGNGQLGRGEGWQRWKTDWVDEWMRYIFRRERERMKEKADFSSLFREVKSTCIFKK